MTHPERIIIEPRVALAAAAAEWIAVSITRAVVERGQCTLALAGGTTPRAVYAHLARHSNTVPWSQLDVFFGDERAVPPHHPESNFHVADEILFRHVPLPRERIHRMEADRSDLESAARDYDALLPDQLDILLLGMGVDGHTASLFPEASSLTERERRVVAVESPVLPLTRRLTITPPVIAAARRVAVIITGGEKAFTVQQALEGPFHPNILPIQFALAATWFLDREAAGMLQRIPA